jgi:hypothetical protein
MEELSVRSVLAQIVMQVIILLYFLDNETSYMVIASSVVTLLLEIWKLRKAATVKLELKRPGPDSIIPFPYPVFTLGDKEGSKYTASKTNIYDQIATSHMLRILFPVAFGFSIFSLFYSKHKTVYSWIVTSLVNFVYIFGFAASTPQLYVNYRLRSVAAIPMRALVFKFLNTILDDLFAFIIKTPTLYRIAVFRDDLIFVLFLGQRFILRYPVDRTRKNEFGVRAVRRGKLDKETTPSLSTKTIT